MGPGFSYRLFVWTIVVFVGRVLVRFFFGSVAVLPLEDLHFRAVLRADKLTFGYV